MFYGLQSEKFSRNGAYCAMILFLEYARAAERGSLCYDLIPAWIILNAAERF